MFCILKAMASPAMVSLRESYTKLAHNNYRAVTKLLQNCYKSKPYIVKI